MNLSFQEDFIPKIENGSKIHTIRLDKNNKWGAGRLIHFCTGLRTTNYKQYFQKICVSIQIIEIFPKDNEQLIYIDGNLFEKSKWNILSKNDGFDSVEDFLKWDSWNNKHFKGKIIHWTNKKY